MRRNLFLLTLLAIAPAAFAETPAKQGQFLDKSIITFQRAAGAYSLAETHYDPGQWAYGVTSQWRINGAPDSLRLSVFVYPVGRASEEAVVAQHIADVEGGLHAAVDEGTYADLAVDAVSNFDVKAPASSVLRSEDTEAPPDNHGRRQAYRYSQEGVAMRSLGYLFYRHLFAFKVRITAPADSMDDTTFSALADTAVRTLVPRIEVINYGLCGHIAISVPEGSKGKTKAGVEAVSRQMGEEVARVQAENCLATEGEATSAEARVEKRVEIVYPPEAWKPQD